MKTIYPLVPKSTARLEPGQFWAFPIRGKAYACGVVLQLVTINGKKDNRSFIAGLLNWTGTKKPIGDDLKDCEVLEHGQAHIKSIVETGGEILGKIPWKESRLEIPLSLNESPGRNCMLRRGNEILGKASSKQQKELEVFGTWGFKFISRLAEKHFANVA
ncbi:MAG: hypothetical protein HKO58_09695 [Gammaproteobacteria bacterium]|nr:hypothetical protein [Gammaproteobacteria bacterium]